MKTYQIAEADELVKRQVKIGPFARARVALVVQNMPHHEVDVVVAVANVNLERAVSLAPIAQNPCDPTIWVLVELADAGNIVPIAASIAGLGCICPDSGSSPIAGAWCKHILWDQVCCVDDGLTCNITLDPTARAHVF